MLQIEKADITTPMAAPRRLNGIRSATSDKTLALRSPPKAPAINRATRREVKLGERAHIRVPTIKKKKLNLT